MTKEGHASLDSIQIAVHGQSQGIGSMLLKDFIERAVTEGFSKAALNVHVGNPAIRLYQKHGFSEAKRTASHIRMEKSLENI